MSKESSDVQAASRIIIEAFKWGNKLLIFGNGGSAAMAQHMASELVWRLYKERKALPAIALTSDVATLTAIANDEDYRFVFSRQIEALGQAGDVALGLSTSGNSLNILEGLWRALGQGLKTIELNSCHFSDSPFDVSLEPISSDTGMAQEEHLRIIHQICDLVEREFD